MRISDWSSDVCSSDLQSAAIPTVLPGICACHRDRRHAVSDLAGCGTGALTMRISTSFMQLRALNAVLSNQATISDVQQQVASGKRILSPAFDPVGSARALDL